MRDYGDVTPYVYLLSRLGAASGLTNNVAKPLSGVWSQEPVVASGLTDMRTYDPAYEASQEIETDVTGLTYQTGGVYKVAAYARLVTSGGQYTWVADEFLPKPTDPYYYVDSTGQAYNRWEYTVTPPTMTYTFDWHGTVEDIEYVSARLYVHSLRNNPNVEHYIYASHVQVYFDYINQATGAQVSQLADTHTLWEGEAWIDKGCYIYLYNVKLNSLASNIRVRVVISNGDSHFYSAVTTQTASWEYVRFTGGALFKSSSAGRATIYNGAMSALAVGR